MRLIVVTGGVMSGVGKGTATASIGKILQEYGFTVTAVKIDPYINYDAGTLRPTEHGEVWVTDDGGETDQDLGNYERMLGIDLSRINNITTGQIYKAIIDRERKGDYLGQTVQFIPHVPDEIKRRIKAAGEGVDFCLIEIGGTIGDYENLPYLFATKSLEVELGRQNVAHVLVTYLPVPSHVGEMKTKPTQQAIRLLNEAGIFPDFVLCRSEKALDSVRKKKIETYANIGAEQIISAPDALTIYQIPLNFEGEALGKKLLARFGVMQRRAPSWAAWQQWVNKIEKPSRKVRVAIVGKYVDIGDYSLADSYVSVNQALEHAGAALDIGVAKEWVDSRLLEKGNASALQKYDGIIVPGGFGASGVAGKIAAITFARENDVPYLGLCYGMQMAMIEFARNVCGLGGADTTENARTRHPVIDILPSQRAVMKAGDYGGTMRLGAYAAVMEDSLLLRLYKETKRLDSDMKQVRALLKRDDERFRVGITGNARNIVLERHRHRYEVNPKYVKQLSGAGMLFPGFHVRADRTRLMEFIELRKHRFFVGTQAHPEFKSRLGDPSPLFYGFVRACNR